MKKIAVYNIKGGEAKTTVAKTIATGLALRGKKVLLHDIDGQANCSKTFIDTFKEHDYEMYSDLSVKESELCFIDKYMNQNHGRTVSDVFTNPKCVKEVIQKTKYDKLDIIPSDLKLFLTDTELRLQDGDRQNKLKRASNFVKNDYDYAIYDCSPVKSLLSVNVLYTEPLVIIPVSPYDDAMQGLALTINEINTIKELYEELEIDYRILIVREKRNIECRDNKAEILAAFKEKVMKTEIREQAKPIEKAARERKSLFDLKPSNIQNDFQLLIDELEVM